MEKLSHFVWETAWPNGYATGFLLRLQRFVPSFGMSCLCSFGKRALSGWTPAPAASREGLPSQTPAPLQEKSCTHIPASWLITSVLSEICFSGTSCLPDFLGSHFSCFGRVLSWNHAPPCHAVKVPCSAIKPQGIYSQHICTCEYPSTALSQPPSKADGTAHSSHMSQKQGAESLWRTELEVSQALSQLFCNSALAG